MFINVRLFDFVTRLEASWEVIRDEYLSLPEDAFEPWVQREMYGDGWSVFGLYAFGERIDAAIQACPHTASALGHIPGLTTAGFSRLAPETHIRPHVGWVRTVYRSHLGLIVPDECGMRVGSETRSWREGECLIFDDTIEHEAWNHSTRTRVVLLFDFLRPSSTEAVADRPPAEVRRFLRRRMRTSQ
jgi:aspartyl/asparaginyl beta-hydroxylase (cupin superfamily)